MMDDSFVNTAGKLACGISSKTGSRTRGPSPGWIGGCMDG